MFPRRLKHVSLAAFIGASAIMAGKYIEATNETSDHTFEDKKPLFTLASGAYASLPSPHVAPSLYPRDVAFTYILGTQRKDTTQRLADERNWLEHTQPIIGHKTNHLLTIGDGMTALDFAQLPKQINQNGKQAKHNIVWVNVHGLPAKMYSPEAQDSFYVDTFLGNEYTASLYLEGALLSPFIENLKDVAPQAQNTFIIQVCHGASSIMAVKDHKPDDMSIFPDPCGKSTAPVYPFFLQSLASGDTTSTKSLSRSLLVQQLLVANAMIDPEKRNLFIFTIKTHEKVDDPYNNGAATRVISLEDECKNLGRYDSDAILLAMRQNNMQISKEFGTYIQNISRSMHSNADLYALDGNQFLALTLAAYCTSMAHLSDMPRLSEYFPMHNVVRRNLFQSHAP